MYYGARPNECCSRSWFFWFLACTSLQAWYMTGAALVFLSVNATVYVFLGPRLATVSLIVSSIAFSFDSIIGLFTTVLPPISLALGLLLAWHLLHEVGMCVRVRVRACVCVCLFPPSSISAVSPCPLAPLLSHSLIHVNGTPSCPLHSASWPGRVAVRSTTSTLHPSGLSLLRFVALNGECPTCLLMCIASSTKRCFRLF